VQRFLALHAAERCEAQYEHNGKRYLLAGQRTSELGTRFGKVRFVRRVGILLEGRGPSDLPIDRELGLCSGFSLGVVTHMTGLCSQLPFKTARSVFLAFHGWTPSSRSVLRMVDAVGDLARPFLEQAPAPADDDGDVLVIQVDGRGAPMINEVELKRMRQTRAAPSSTRRKGRRLRRRAYSRARRTKGKKSKNAKVAVVGVLYTLRQTPEGVEGPIHKRLVATFESHEALFKWLRPEADKRGYGNKRTLFIADGSSHIWAHQRDFFPKAEACVDWYHIVEKLWSAGESIHSEGSKELDRWVARQSLRLRNGEVDTVLRSIAESLNKTPKSGPGNKGKRMRIEKTLRHLTKHRQRMPYKALRADDLDIGSGAVEGAVRNLVAIRLDGPGMRWSRDRSERVLHLRCILLNDQWDHFTSYLQSRPCLPLPAVPTPTRTHDAKLAA